VALLVRILTMPLKITDWWCSGCFNIGCPGFAQVDERVYIWVTYK